MRPDGDAVLLDTSRFTMVEASARAASIVDKAIAVRQVKDGRRRGLHYREPACIKQHRVLSRPHWGYGAPSVAGVTVTKVAENPFPINRRILLRQFQIPAFGTYLIGRENEYLAIRVRADHRSDVTAVENRSPA